MLVESTGDAEVRPGVRVRRLDRVETGVDPLAPGTAWAESVCETEVAWPEVTAGSRARLELRSDPHTWFFDLRLDVHENGEHRTTRRWRRQTPRKLQ